MMEVVKTVHDFCHLEAAVKLNLIHSVQLQEMSTNSRSVTEIFRLFSNYST